MCPFFLLGPFVFFHSFPLAVRANRKTFLPRHRNEPALDDSGEIGYLPFLLPSCSKEGSTRARRPSLPYLAFEVEKSVSGHSNTVHP